MKKTDWKGFLEQCDISHWCWESKEDMNIIAETEDKYIIKLSIFDLAYDPVIEFEEDYNVGVFGNTGDGEWILITNFDEEPTIFAKVFKTIDKTDNYYHCDGRIYVI
jgi:hypothetical protein